MKKMGIKVKLIMSFLAAALIPLAVISFYSFWKAQDSLTNSALEQVESVKKLTQAQLDDYFNGIKGQLITLSSSHGIHQAFYEFKKGFQNYAKEASWSNVDAALARKKLGDYYRNEFSEEYKKQNAGKTIDILANLNRLTDEQVFMQYAYIANNENPLGKKDALNAASDDTSYNKTHQIHHTNLREYLNQFGYYDIFLVDAETGNIVYSVFKELDFATSLKTGPYAESSLGKSFRKALAQSDTSEVSMADFEQYVPSYDAPAGFVSSPLIDESGKVFAVMIFQLSTDKINAITLAQHSNYKSLETFMVGPDFKLRSDTRGDSANLNVKNSFRNPEKGSVENDNVKSGLKGESLTALGKDYLGRPVATSFSPYNIFGNRWVLTTIVLQEELFSSIIQMRWALFIGSLIAALIVSFVALWYARSLALTLTRLAGGLHGGADTVSKTSQTIADVSTRLSEASTEQAASLQETVASIDEISAMVQRNADSAANSSRASEVSTSAAHRGKEKVEQMLTSINEISRGNEDIVSSIQKSNQEISEIVHVIKAIADKTKVINDIVFQTKLLSFNASVEAARAGEHGKGFAVVAEEVGNLASMSGKAATEISDMLDKSVLQVTRIVEGTRGMMESLIKNSKDKVDFGTKTAKECASALDEIMRNVTSVNEMVKEISTASQEQSSGVREITKAMSELDQVTQQNTASSNDASHTARELSSQAEILNQYVRELSELVHGHHSETHEHSPVKTQSTSVHKLDDYRQPKKSQPTTNKKVVGLEFDTPKSNDSRFEDV